MDREFEEFVKISFAEMIRRAGKTSVVANFVVVAEVVDGESSEIVISLSDGITPWLADGMLRAAGDMVAQGKWEIRDNGDTQEE